MSEGIEFNEEQEQIIQRPAMASTGPSLATITQQGFLFRIIRKAGAQTDSQAQVILLGIGLVSLAISMFIIGYFVFGVGRLQGAVKYDIPDEMISKFPPDIQQQIIEAKRK